MWCHAVLSCKHGPGKFGDGRLNHSNCSSNLGDLDVRPRISLRPRSCFPLFTTSYTTDSLYKSPLSPLIKQSIRDTTRSFAGVRTRPSLHCRKSLPAGTLPGSAGCSQANPQEACCRGFLRWMADLRP